MIAEVLSLEGISFVTWKWSSSFSLEFRKKLPFFKAIDFIIDPRNLDAFISTRLVPLGLVLTYDICHHNTIQVVSGLEADTPQSTIHSRSGRMTTGQPWPTTAY